ncbi:MAG TPA: SIS domain-containing protein [Chloroflexi bacterium]|nr:MAG: glucosamine--fructose-6-phosphate aminotransferase [Chloroflexota bacterium]HDN05005.1 SIS domain-containing protein [Chloroflexota bacterium]
MPLRDEIFDQPGVLSALLADQLPGLRGIAASVGRPAGIFIAARGTSDNAARYAKYLWGARNRIPVTLAAPSLFSIYASPPQLSGYLVVGISQSGESPDLLAVLKEANLQGCTTLAITNKINSPLALEADFVIDILAGPELSIAATKTYTAQLSVIAMLSAIWEGDERALKQLSEVPDHVKQVLNEEDKIRVYAARYRYMDQCVVLGRGFNYATAFEWSLKMKELAYVVAQPYSSADFLHGPIAMISSGFPVFAVATTGKVFQELAELITRLKENHQADLFLISDHQELMDLADCPVILPKHIPEWLSPIVTIIPAQLLSYHLTIIKGFDPDSPRGLSKVTLTQ